MLTRWHLGYELRASEGGMTARRMLTASNRRTTRVVISANVYNPNIAALATAAGWSTGGKIDLIINSGVDVARLEIPASIPNNTVSITNNGRIGGVSGGRPEAPTTGGTGLYVRSRITLTNNGTIFGAGGRGGDGEGMRLCWGGDCHSANGGNGGRGAGFFSTDGSWSIIEYQSSAGAGNPGGTSTRTPTGYPGDSGSTISAGRGGDGGAIGQPGQNGASASTGGSYDSSTPVARTTPGLAGCYVDGNSNITWIATGTCIGRVI